MASWVKKILIVVVGLLGGFLYYKFFGCQSGICPITSNPVPSTLYGGMIGAMIAFIGTGKKEK